MPTFRQSTLALLVLLSLPAGATNYPVEYGGGPPPAPVSGMLNDDFFLGDVDPVFHRPDGECSADLRREYFRYDTITLTNTGNSEVGVDFGVDTGPCDNIRDSVAIGYSPSFNPAEPNANCSVYNDNFYGTCSLVSTAIAPNEVVVFVVTSNLHDELWPWTATFTVHDQIFEGDFELMGDVYTEDASTP